jgi:hypothetical protein
LINLQPLYLLPCLFTHLSQVQPSMVFRIET